MNLSKFNKLKLLYEEIEFININKKYDDEEDGEFEIWLTDDNKWLKFNLLYYILN